MAGQRKRDKLRGERPRRHLLEFPEPDVNFGHEDDHHLFQTSPPFIKPSLHKPKGWTDSVAGYIREAKELTKCLIRNERLLGRPYQWHLNINFEAEQTPTAIKKRWAKVCRKLRMSGVVALCVMEVGKSNCVHFHLIVSKQIGRSELEQAVEKAMPPRDEIRWHKCLQPIEAGETWQLAHYVTKAKIAGYINGAPVEDYYANKRILFRPSLGLVKFRQIGRFWLKPKAAIWNDIRAKEERIAKGLEQPGVRRLVGHVYELLDKTEPIKKIERSLGYHANSDTVRRWVEQLLADGNDDYEHTREGASG